MVDVQRKRRGENALQGAQTVLQTLNQAHHAAECRSGHGSTLLKSRKPFAERTQDLKGNVSSSTSHQDVLSGVGSFGACSWRASNRLAAEELLETCPEATERNKIDKDRLIGAPALRCREERSVRVVADGEGAVLAIAGKAIHSDCRRATRRYRETVSVIRAQFHRREQRIQVLEAISNSLSSARIIYLIVRSRLVTDVVLESKCKATRV